MNQLKRNISKICSSLDLWTMAGGVRLRSYQREVGEVIVHAALRGIGGSFAVMYPRQSGKNELQAWIESYLLFIRSLEGADLVKISPTWKPQSLNAMKRLEQALRSHPLTKSLWVCERGYQYRIGEARISFFSGQKEANIVGATANLLLEVDEAQDVDANKFDKEISPMAASANAVRVFWGTAWTDKTLLKREFEYAARNNTERVWRIDADQVRAEVPAYGIYVDEQIHRLGRSHPLIRSQYYSEEVTQEVSLFTANRRAMMQGEHPWLDKPKPGELYALLVDVGGGISAAAISGKEDDRKEETGRDATAVNIVRVNLSKPDIGPVYEIVHRSNWVGEEHPLVYAKLKAMAELWEARYVVVDATGMGESLAGFLERALPGKVVRYVFTAKSKSDLGWAWLAAIETGRYKEYQPYEHVHGADMSREFWRQIDHCEAVPSSTGSLLRWGVPDGRRDELGLVHDDLIVSAALCTVLGRLTWGAGESVVISPHFEDQDWGRF